MREKTEIYADEQMDDRTDSLTDVNPAWEQGLRCEINRLRSHQNFLEFDVFIIRKMMGQEYVRENITEQIRRTAYREFMKRIGINRVAAVQTIQKWFGIHGQNRPKREMIFKIGFALGLDEEEVNEYLRKGIRECGISINDYREMIFLYGLQNHLTYEECLTMMECFEQRLPVETQFCQESDTQKLWTLFHNNQNLEKEEFIEWMLQYGEYFKGYSMTALEYFRSLKQEILEEMKKDAAKRLEELLQETSFERWEKRQGLRKEDRRETIPKYIRSEVDDEGKSVSEALGKSILEMLELSVMPLNSNAEFLAALYAVDTKTKKTGRR